MQNTGTLTTLEQALLNNFQHDLPMSLTPYADIAEQLGVTEEEVIATLRLLRDSGYISRIGPVFRPNRVGVSTLAAMTVPGRELEHVAGIVNAFGEVNHNYEREHEYNLWFVLTASDDSHLDKVLQEIEEQTGYTPMSLPMQEDYFIDLGFRLPWA